MYFPYFGACVYCRCVKSQNDSRVGAERLSGFTRHTFKQNNEGYLATRQRPVARKTLRLGAGALPNYNENKLFGRIRKEEGGGSRTDGWYSIAHHPPTPMSAAQQVRDSCYPLLKVLPHSLLRVKVKPFLAHSNKTLAEAVQILQRRWRQGQSALILQRRWRQRQWRRVYSLLPYKDPNGSNLRYISL